MIQGFTVSAVSGELALIILIVVWSVIARFLFYYKMVVSRGNSIFLNIMYGHVVIYFKGSIKT